MKIKQFFAENFSWEWRTPILLVAALIPAVLVGVFVGAQEGVAAVLGMIPAAMGGVAPTRKKRVYILLLGFMIPLSLFLGVLIRMLLNMWLAALAMGLLGVGASLLASKNPKAALGTGLAVPVIGIGLSYSDFAVAWGMFVAMVAGSVLAFLLSLLFPEFTEKPPPLKRVLLRGQTPRESGPSPKAYSLLYGAALATATLLGYGWDHTGWVVGSTGLVMRPSEKIQLFRAIWRFVSVVLGALAVSVVLALEPGAMVVVGSSAIALILCGGLHKSRAYILPAFMTYIVFMLILYPETGGHSILYRFLERVGWVAVGVLVACFYGLLLPKLFWRKKRPVAESK